MRAWLLRVVLVLWLALYPVIHIPLMIPLVAVLGSTLAALVGALVIGIWGSVFYFLLRRESVLTGAKTKLVQIRNAGGVLGWINTKIPEVRDGALLSPFWIQVSFVLLGAIVNTLVSVLVIYGPPAILARELITALLER